MRIGFDDASQLAYYVRRLNVRMIGDHEGAQQQDALPKPANDALQVNTGTGSGSSENNAQELLAKPVPTLGLVLSHGSHAKPVPAQTASQLALEKKSHTNARQAPLWHVLWSQVCPQTLQLSLSLWRFTHAPSQLAAPSQCSETSTIASANAPD